MYKRMILGINFLKKYLKLNYTNNEDVISKYIL